MYLLYKVVHLIAVVAFLGNIVTGVFWHRHATRTGDARLIAHAMDGIIRSDRLFTVPGVVVIVASGLAGAVEGGLPILGTPWIFWTIVLFSVSGIVFAWRVAPLQRTLRAAAEAGARSGEFDAARYRALALRWEIWGAVAVITPLAGLVLMVFKPGR